MLSQPLTLALFLITTTSVAGICANSCSGHGTCDSDDKCTCFDEGKTLYFGKDADPVKARSYNYSTRYGTTGTPIRKRWTGANCSLHTCPRGISWRRTEVTSSSTKLCYNRLENGQGPWLRDAANDGSCATNAGAGKEWRELKHVTPSHIDDVECSDAGTCDRTTGICQCDAGYEGSACQRTSCPNDCSGHGICQSNQKFASAAGARYEYAWDSGNHMGCLCDPGFRGSDCSLQECPSGDDPLHYQGNNRGRDCSGRGLCDYNTGLCSCFPGYSGHKCDSVEALA